MNPSPIDKKFEAFGWNVLVIDGDKCYNQRNELLEVKEREK